MQLQTDNLRTKNKLTRQFLNLSIPGTVITLREAATVGNKSPLPSLPPLPLPLAAPTMKCVNYCERWAGLPTARGRGGGSGEPGPRRSLARYLSPALSPPAPLVGVRCHTHARIGM